MRGLMDVEKENTKFIYPKFFQILELSLEFKNNKVVYLVSFQLVFWREMLGD